MVGMKKPANALFTIFFNSDPMQEKVAYWQEEASVKKY